MLSSYARDLLLSWLLTNGAAVRPTTWFISLHVGDPGLVGSNELLVGTDAAYVRQAITFGAPSSGAAPSLDTLSWTADVAATTHDITHIGVWDALSGGNFLLPGALAVPENRIAGSTMVLSAGRAIGRLT